VARLRLPTCAEGTRKPAGSEVERTGIEPVTSGLQIRPGVEQGVYSEIQIRRFCTLGVPAQITT
jgi:hypothetical protein